MGNSKLKSTKLSNLLKIRRIPLKIAIEPTNICNANCSFCAHKYSTKRGVVIEFETYKRF